MTLTTRRRHKIIRASIFVASLLGMNAAKSFAAAATLDATPTAENGEEGVGSALLDKLQEKVEHGLRNFDMGHFNELDIGEKIVADDAEAANSKGSKKSKKSKQSKRTKSYKSTRNGTAVPHSDSDGHMGPPVGRNYKEARIIGGKEAEEDFYSFAVALQDSGGQFCGGSLIAKDVVLTAAHCQGPPFEVVVGRHDLRDSDGEVIPIIEQRPHPSYSTRNTDNDVMLVFLSRATTGNVKLVKVNDDPSSPEINESVTVMGWGDTNIRDDVSTLSQVLLKVSVNVITNDECEQSSDDFDSYRGQITANMVCAKGNLEDSCQGDSGGPLVFRKGGGQVQVGVVSWGIGCANKNFPGVYARLSRSHDWIQREVCKSSIYASEAGFTCNPGNSDSGSKPTNKPSRKPSGSTPSSNSGGKGTDCDNITDKVDCKGTLACRWRRNVCVLRKKEEESENGDGDDVSLYSNTAL